MSDYHTTVLLNETIDYLQVIKGKMYIDATLGGGGHTGKIIEKGGIVLGIDADEEALEFVKKNFQFPISNFQLRLVKGNFKDIDKIASENNLVKAAGAILDLGVSSHQLEKAERGFSFMKDGPLDMRMDQELGVKAADLLHILTKSELSELLFKMGEERFANRIADAIVRVRKEKPIETTKELVDTVRGVVPNYKTEINPATRVFQALRIVINDELNSLREGLPKILDLIESRGRICIISFHSLEDRIVKHQFREWEEKDMGHVITKKPVTPSLSEIEKNRRSRSSKLRVFEKK